MSDFIPNSFQTPNAYVDKYMSLLTAHEWVVLSYAIRRIFGFQKRQDRISLSQFTSGTKNRDGEILDSGTGLSLATVKKCLNSLCEFGLIIKIAENNSKLNQGTLWGLQLESDKIQLEKLIERQERQAKGNKRRMKKARSMRQTPTSGIEGGAGSDIEAPPASGIETQNTGKQQGNTDIKAGKPAKQKLTDIPELVVYREVVRHWPKQAQRDIVIEAVQKINRRLGRAAAKEDLNKFWLAWNKVSGNEWSLVWLDWAVSGNIPTNGNGHKPSVQQSYDAIDRVLGV